MLLSAGTEHRRPPQQQPQNPCSLGNAEQLGGSEGSRGEPQSSYPCRQVLNPYDLGNGLQVFTWEGGEGDDGNTHAWLTA